MKMEGFADRDDIGLIFKLIVFFSACARLDWINFDGPSDNWLQNKTIRAYAGDNPLYVKSYT